MAATGKAAEGAVLFYEALRSLSHSHHTMHTKEKGRLRGQAGRGE